MGERLNKGSISEKVHMYFLIAIFCCVISSNESHAKMSTASRLRKGNLCMSPGCTFTVGLRQSVEYAISLELRIESTKYVLLGNNEQAPIS